MGATKKEFIEFAQWIDNRLGGKLLERDKRGGRSFFPPALIGRFMHAHFEQGRSQRDLIEQVRNGNEYKRKHPPPGALDLTPNPMLGDFLGSTDRLQERYTHMWPDLNEPTRAVHLARHPKEFNTFSIGTINKIDSENRGDYTSQGIFRSFNLYDDLPLAITLMTEIASAGKAPLNWLSQDDMRGFHQNSVSYFKRKWPTYLAAVNPVCKMFIIGLESTEYWTPDEQLALMRLALRSTTPDTWIGWHGQTGEWSGDMDSGHDRKQNWWRDLFDPDHKDIFGTHGNLEWRGRVFAALQIKGRSESDFVRRLDEITNHALNHVRVWTVYAEGSNEVPPGPWGSLALEVSGCRGTLHGIDND